MRYGYGYWPGARRSVAAAITGFVSAVGADAAAVTSLAATAGSDWATGDLLVAKVGTATAATPNTPAGWTLAAAVGGYAYFTRAHDGSASYTFTLPSSQNMAVVIGAWRGFSVGVVSTWSAASATPAPPNITPLVANSINLYLAGVATGTTYAAPSGFVQRVARNSNRSLVIFERTARVPASSLAGTAIQLASGAASGRAAQMTLTPA